MFSCFAVVTVGRSPSRDQLRQLQNVHHDAVEEKPKRRTRLQRLRSLLQTAQRKWNINNLRFVYKYNTYMYSAFDRVTRVYTARTVYPSQTTFTPSV